MRPDLTTVGAQFWINGNLVLIYSNAWLSGGAALCTVRPCGPFTGITDAAPAAAASWSSGPVRRPAQFGCGSGRGRVSRGALRDQQGGGRRTPNTKKREFTATN
jgi:hypothetical protein